MVNGFWSPPPESGFRPVAIYGRNGAEFGEGNVPRPRPCRHLLLSLIPARLQLVALEISAVLLADASAKRTESGA